MQAETLAAAATSRVAAALSRASTMEARITAVQKILDVLADDVLRTHSLEPAHFEQRDDMPSFVLSQAVALMTCLTLTTPTDEQWLLATRVRLQLFIGDLHIVYNFYLEQPDDP